MYTQSRDRRLLMDISVSGRIGIALEPLDVPQQPLPDPENLRDNLSLPEVSQGEVIRYFTNLSQMNFSVDTNYYPLGSCTMKYNPKINNEIASLTGFTDIHPLQDIQTTQGALELMYDLQYLLAHIVGMEHASLASVAGAHGELTGMLMIRAYHDSRKDYKRNVVLVPDSAHGTNPASAAMAGYTVISIPSDKNGNMDIEVLKSYCTEETAGIMLTLPNTLGLFDPNIVDICAYVHQCGGLVYGDGANMNALLGRAHMSTIGFDVLHLNLHKTFSTPHGGGGPGAGPVLCNDRLASFLPTPVIAKHENIYLLDSPSQTIGKIGGFHGNFGILVRAYAYIKSMGKQGMLDISENAVINANYILTRLKDDYYLPYDRNCMHEVIFSAKPQRSKGIRALDIAKRLIDYGIHPPTMYFPLIVEEALMIEPTESESKDTLDYFISVMQDIAKEVESNPQLLKDAPHNTPNTRLDEAKAARQPDLRWTNNNSSKG